MMAEYLQLNSFDMWPKGNTVFCCEASLSVKLSLFLYHAWFLSLSSTKYIIDFMKMYIGFVCLSLCLSVGPYVCRWPVCLSLLGCWNAVFQLLPGHVVGWNVGYSPRRIVLQIAEKFLRGVWSLFHFSILKWYLLWNCAIYNVVDKLTI